MPFAKNRFPLFRSMLWPDMSGCGRLRLAFPATSTVHLAIRRLLVKSAFSPEEVRVLCAAYDEIIAGLSLQRVRLLLAEAIAKKVIAVAHAGERDFERVVERVYAEIGVLPNRPHKPRSN